MKDLQTLLNKRYSQQRKNKYIDDKTIFHIFLKVIREEYGNQGVKNIIPEYYKKNIIFISFKQSLWAQEIWLNKQILINKVNEKIGNKILYNIKVKY